MDYVDEGVWTLLTPPPPHHTFGSGRVYQSFKFTFFTLSTYIIYIKNTYYVLLISTIQELDINKN